MARSASPQPPTLEDMSTSRDTPRRAAVGATTSPRSTQASPSARRGAQPRAEPARRRSPEPVDEPTAGGPPADGSADVPGASEHTGWLLKQAVIYTARAVDAVVRDHGVSVAQWAVLNRLVQHRWLSGAELARLMLISPQAAQQALTTLDEMGLVERTPDPNHGRILRAALTAEGRRVAELCWADSLRIEANLMAPFSATEREVFTDLLRRYVRQFDVPGRDLRDVATGASAGPARVDRATPGPPHARRSGRRDTRA
jgi:DNA-binding MarR family transcriptional regulator